MCCTAESVDLRLLRNKHECWRAQELIDRRTVRYTLRWLLAPQSRVPRLCVQDPVKLVSSRASVGAIALHSCSSARGGCVRRCTYRRSRVPAPSTARSILWHHSFEHPCGKSKVGVGSPRKPLFRTRRYHLESSLPDADPRRLQSALGPSRSGSPAAWPQTAARSSAVLVRDAVRSVVRARRVPCRSRHGRPRTQAVPFPEASPGHCPPCLLVALHVLSMEGCSTVPCMYLRI